MRLYRHRRPGAANTAEIKHEARQALQQLYSSSPAARNLGKQARAILVFPKIVKAGLVIGAQHGDGALISNGRTVGYYRTDAASYGLQAGVQKYGYAMFFMSDDALAYLRKSDGWEIGVGPSVVIESPDQLRKSIAFALCRRPLQLLQWRSPNL